MSNTSATGGYLDQVDLSAPVDDLALAIQIQNLVAGITGLPGPMVMPRWQPSEPKQPEASVNWCSVGVQDIDPGGGTPEQIHVPDGSGSNDLRRTEMLEILTSFYGPRCTYYASTLRDGLYIDQNLWVVKSQGMGLIDVGRTTSLPALLNQQWVRRVDLPFRLRRRVDRSYRILNVVEADGIIIASRPGDLSVQEVPIKVVVEEI